MSSIGTPPETQKGTPPIGPFRARTYSAQPTELSPGTEAHPTWLPALATVVHTYDRRHSDGEHAGPDHPRRRRFAPGERLLGHERPGDRDQGRRGDRQPPVLVSDQVGAAR